MKASDEQIKKIKEFEGFSNTAYTCAGGVVTIGYGHTKGVRINDRCTGNEAERWLRTQGKYDALCSFIFNLGMGNFKSSTLLKKIKAGAPTEDIQAEFKRWVYAKKKVLKGLVKRREWEARRWAQ